MDGEWQIVDPVLKDPKDAVVNGRRGAGSVPDLVKHRAGHARDFRDDGQGAVAADSGRQAEVDGPLLKPLTVVIVADQ